GRGQRGRGRKPGSERNVVVERHVVEGRLGRRLRRFAALGRGAALRPIAAVAASATFAAAALVTAAFTAAARLIAATFAAAALAVTAADHLHFIGDDVGGVVLDPVLLVGAVFQ